MPESKAHREQGKASGGKGSRGRGLPSCLSLLPFLLVPARGARSRREESPGQRGRRASWKTLLGLLVALVLLGPPALSARQIYQGGETSLDLGATYKNLFLANRFYEIPGVEDRVFSTDYQRGRILCGLKLPLGMVLEAHYQHLALLNVTGQPIPFPGTEAVRDTSTSFRGTALSWDQEESRDLSWIHELDRLSLSMALNRLDLILGRQAITWGTGRFWQPTDLLSPFGPLQVDREFKAGTDAARLLVALGDFTQAELVWAFGEDADPDRSAGLFRFKTLLKNFDISLLAGRVKTDAVAGADFAGDLGDTGIGIHGECLYNRVEAGSDYGQALVGLDYRFPGKGPYLLGEYYYHGAGATDGPGLERALQDERILSRGSFQLGRHYVGLGATYEIFPILQGMLNALVNLTDPSAIFNPALEYSIADNASATLGMVIPVGEEPTFVLPGSGLGIPEVRLNSELGTYPLTFFLEVKFYVQ